MKIKNKKQLIKIADAVRMLYPAYVWMWISRTGDVHLSMIKPFQAGDVFGYSTGQGVQIVCPSGFDLKINVEDTLVQLRST